MSFEEDVLRESGGARREVEDAVLRSGGGGSGSVLDLGRGGDASDGCGFGFAGEVEGVWFGEVEEGLRCGFGFEGGDHLSGVVSDEEGVC